MSAHGLARILGIDHGSRRVGIAISDPMCIIASGLTVLANDHDLLEKIDSLVKSKAIGVVVVGMPTTLKGAKGPKALEVESFVKQLAAFLPVPVFTWDERFTTSIAQATMREMGVRKKQRESRRNIDAMAAAVMLQSYLDARVGRGETEGDPRR